MPAEAKEHLLQDLEAGVAPKLSSSSSSAGFCLPPIALLRRKKVWVLILLIPAIYLLAFNNDTRLTADAGTQMLDALHHAPPAINELAGKLPLAHGYDDQHLDKDGHLRNALLDTMHVQGTDELTRLKNKLEHDSPAVSTRPNNVDLALQLNEMTKFSTKDESVMLLLLALQTKGYMVEDDWQDVYLSRTPFQKGVFATLNSGPSNKFEQLLAKVGLPKPKPKPDPSDSATSTGLFSPKFSILNDAHQLYMLSRQDWVDKVRPSLGLTVFSKSFCPYSKKAKALLDSHNATYTVYQVDTRPDAHQLQPLLARLTGHKTFPTILVRDRLLGGNDDLHDLNSIHALKSILESVGAL